jgi:hypothetical protein
LNDFSKRDRSQLFFFDGSRFFIRVSRDGMGAMAVNPASFKKENATNSFSGAAPGLGGDFAQPFGSRKARKRNR